LLVRHHAGPNLVGIEVVSRIVDKRVGLCTGEARDKAFAQKTALRVPPIGVETVADDRFAAALHVGHNRDDARGHLAEIDVGVTDRRTDGRYGLSYFDNFHVRALRKSRTLPAACNCHTRAMTWRIFLSLAPFLYAARRNAFCSSSARV